MKQIVSLGSDKAFGDHGVSRFIDDLCTIDDDSEFVYSYRKIDLKK